MSTTFDRINNLLRSSEGRFQSILAIPSKNKTIQIYDNIIRIISFIKENEPLLDEFNQWFSEEFSKSKNVIYNSRKTLERANIIRLNSEGKVLLTKMIEDNYSKSGKLKAFISLGFLEAFHGMLEILETVLNNDSKKITLQLLFCDWHSNYESTYNTIRSRRTSHGQFSIMIRYLSSFGLLEISKDKMASINTKLLQEVLNLMDSFKK